MTQRIAIVPYGVGIGDMVNMRPVAEAIALSFPAAAISMVAPQAFDWLLPDDVSILGNVRGLRAWQRTAVTHPLARLTASWKVGRLAPFVRAMPMGRLASIVTRDLRGAGFNPVINLLEYFGTLDLDRRWTVGPWNVRREHVIDLLFSHLESAGLRTDAANRTPRITIAAASHDSRPAIVMNPHAGSTLKEAPVDLWIQLARALQARGILPLVLAAPGRHMAQAICRAVQGSVLLTSGNLQQAAAWIAGADLFISPDTGLLHIASALGVPYIGLFGSTDPEFLGPYDRSVGTVLETRFHHEPVCKACWTSQILPSGRCPLYASSSCVGGIDVEQILSVVDDALHRLDREPVGRVR